MDLSLPALLITLPLLMALIARVTGRWPRLATGIGMVGALSMTALALAAGRVNEPAAADWVVIGRSFELTPFVAQFLAVLAVGLAVLYVLQWVSPGPRALVPGGLAALAFLAAALMIQPFAFGAIFLAAATACVVPSLYNGRFAAAMSSWLAFLAVALAMPLLVAAGWLLDSGQAQGSGAQIALLLASLLLLGGFPFYLWLSGVARSAPMPAMALLIGVVGAAVAVWLAQVLDQFPVVRGSGAFQTGVLGSVLLSSLVAAFGLLRAADWRAWMAYGLVFDAGLQVATLTVPGSMATAVLATGTISRLLVLLFLVALLDSDTSEPLPTTGERVVRQRVMLAFGALALVGVPLTPVFAARWATLPALAGSSPLVLALVLAAMGVAAVAGVRYALRGDLPLTGSRSGSIASAMLLIIALLMGLAGPLLLDYWMKLVVG